MPFYFGKNFKVTIFGASHSACVGVKIDGVKPGTPLDLEKIQDFINKRKPEKSYETKRKETDEIILVSGVKNGFATGDGICVIFENKNIRPDDYKNITKIPRPSHSDLGSYFKYGEIFAGGGFFSGRMTLPMTFAGGVAGEILENYGVKIYAKISSVGEIYDKKVENITENDLKSLENKKIPAFDDEKIEEYIKEKTKNGDSLSCEIEFFAFGMPCGVGGALNTGVESELSHNFFAIPGVKGVTFGETKPFGSENNDEIIMKNGKITTKTNNSGGISGGITIGTPITAKILFKPASSIGMKQKSVDLETKTETILEISGRHDGFYGLRAVPAVISSGAICLLDLILRDGM